MQRSQRFVADQRFDLPQYDSMINYISAEFYAYNQRFFSPNNRVVKNWKIENNGGLQVKINNTDSSMLFNSESPLAKAVNFRESLATEILIDLADNSTNYVELKIFLDTCAPDTVAIWDSSANGGTGEEFTQTVDTALEQRPELVANTIAFTNDPDKVPLAIVTTSGGVIVSIVDSRKLLFELESDWNFGLTRTDRTIDSFKSAYDALATSIREVKGSANWYDLPYAGNKVLKEYQNMFFTGGGTILWEGANGANNLSWNAPIEILIADRAWTYTIDASVAESIPEGHALYVNIPENAPVGSLIPIVADMSAVPIDPASAGYSAGIQVLFLRKNGRIYGMMDIPELVSGESATIGEDLPKNIRARLGIISETVYEPYTSANTIQPADSYATAISKMDAAFTVFASDEAKEEWFTVVGVPQTTFTTSMNIINDNVKFDIQVYINGVRMRQATDGTPATGEYIKTSTTSIEFFQAVSVNARVCIRDERSGAALSGGGGVDLTNIVVDPQPLSNGSQALGTVAKSWEAVYLKDTLSSQVYRLEVTGGVFQIVAVP